ncbi:MAG: RIP metalloprotease RseP, partial [Syntrophales bacterium]|nr:RIP metalloprotease RseP [Syntrophales bacterium]
MIGINIVAVIILLGVLIFVHELGHFLVAKWSGVGVLKFSLGFGPRLLGRKIGETEYILSAIPLGGYVKMLGESEDEEDLSPDDEKRSFLKQPVFKKIGIVAAGPLFNFLFAILAFAVVYAVGVPVSTSMIGTVQEGSAAFDAG